MKGAYLMAQITSEEEFDRWAYENATPIEKQDFTNEDIKALREYLDKLEELSKVPPPVKLTPEEWDEALTAIEQTGEIPAKYAGRIGKRELTGAMLPPAQAKRRKEGEKFFAYYDIAFEEYHAQFYTVREEYRREIEKVIIANLAGQTTTKKTGGDIADLIKSILDNPEIMRELEKEARRLEKQELPALGSVPNGDSINWLYRVISSKGGRLVQQSNGNRHEEILKQKKGDSLRFTRTNKQNESTVIVEIAQADKYLSKTNKTFIKTFLFTLQKMNAQNFPLEVGFSLQELVDLGMYNNPSNARRAIKEFFAQQKQTMLSGTVKKGRKTVKEEGGILFYHYIIDNGYVKLFVNENFNMEFIAPYFTVFPRFAYALSNNAFNLVRYIFFLARQNTTPIKNKGSFAVSLEAVRENLGLPAPSEVKNSKYKQFIIEPIEAAIEEIEEAAKKAPEAKEYGFTITPVGTDTSNIYKWLEGYLEIGLNGDFAETFVRIATKAEKDRDTWNRIKAAELAKLEAKKEAQGE